MNERGGWRYLAYIADPNYLGEEMKSNPILYVEMALYLYVSFWLD